MYKKISIFLLIFSIFFTTLNFNKVNAASNADIINTSKEYLGIPYLWGGTTTKGFDCSGFLNFVYKKNGITLPRTVSEIYKLGTSVNKNDLKPGDLVFFQTYKKGASHAGIYLGGNKFIHAATSTGISIGDLNTSYWKNTYIGAKRIINDSVNQNLSKGEFHDVSSTHWAYNEIKYFAKNDIINGYPGQFFQPNESITREEMAIVLSKFLNLKLEENNKSPFKDVSNTNQNLKYIVAVQKAGIFNGDQNKNFNPQGKLTRAQFAAIIDRIYVLENKQTVKFNDTKDHWAETSINKLASNGIFKGYGDGVFGPNNNTTRAQTVSILYNLKDKKRR